MDTSIVPTDKALGSTINGLPRLTLWLRSVWRLKHRRDPDVDTRVGEFDSLVVWDLLQLVCTTRIKKDNQVQTVERGQCKVFPSQVQLTSVWVGVLGFTVFSAGTIASYEKFMDTRLDWNSWKLRRGIITGVSEDAAGIETTTLNIGHTNCVFLNNTNQMFVNGNCPTLTRYRLGNDLSLQLPIGETSTRDNQQQKGTLLRMRVDVYLMRMMTSVVKQRYQQHAWHKSSGSIR